MNSIHHLSLFLLACTAFTSSAFIFSNNITSEEIETPVVESSIVKSPIVKASFVEFLSLFEKAKMPFEIGLDDFESNQAIKKTTKSAKRSKKNSSGKETQTLRQFIQDEIFISRMGPPVITPIARFYPNEKTIAVIYKSSQHFSSGQFKMILFDLNGEKIPSQEETLRTHNHSFPLGGQAAYGNTLTFSISANGEIVQKTYKAIWKNDLKKTGTVDNEITDYVLEKTEQFEIGTGGIVAVKVDEGSKDRASLDY